VKALAFVLTEGLECKALIAASSEVDFIDWVEALFELVVESLGCLIEFVYL